MLDAADCLAIAPGDSEMDKPSLVSICSRTGKAGNGKSNVGVGLPERALRLGNGAVTAFRSPGIDRSPERPTTRTWPPR
ncbi:hypothetical protein BV98_002730 [Sphingobium herbicidovorans NBRC 16415]|uniref:Uncharacterized protein n=1 Tax=Sphingobium herbicidovorans (strain ATCC 700291 / DSM 11019 / CCUG 56400 / KCTC 2939 / LMG 18315 / NBRC 16415 / MH) TaxID=1219045 RepID=A0A086P7U8_SPHHM|nr:hypothetical protein [Sphingobium herbicidovorans]KFG89466.1 hypothetical protein BV98_002730 [Sphingobium herbicidovorans NBRC 16415]